MKYLLILGRNVELSNAEVSSYFESHENKILNSELIKNGLLIETQEPLEKGLVNSFGGVVSVGKVIASGKPKEIIKKLENENLYMGKSNKLNYAVWNFSDDYEIFTDYLKMRFKEEKIKATIKHLENRMEMQDGEMAQMVSSKLLDKEYFVFGKDIVCFGEIYETFDSHALEERDMKKPVRREALAISPRLAKILVNLSESEPGKTLLDPFCGIGTILSEALLQEIRVIGIDKDKSAIIGARQNLEWSGFNRTDYRLINGDSTKEKISHADFIATEPDLGEIIRETPTENKARATLEKFEDLIIKVINNFKEDISGKITFTSPYIKIGKKRVGPNTEKILTLTGYTLIYKIPEFRENQIVGRMIYVLQGRK